MSNFSDDILKSILANFSIAEKEYSFQPLTDGYINDTFLVSEDDRPIYILQRVNHLVFRNVEGLMNNVQNALKHLECLDYHKINLVRTLNGSSFYTDSKGDTAYWRLMTYIAESTAYNTTESEEIAFEAGHIIGKFHLLLSDADIDNYIDTIPQFHNLELRKNQFEEALLNGEEEKSMYQNDLPVRICHNDTKLNNILFSKKTGKALCLIDLDTIMKGNFHFDFGDAVRTIVNTAPEDEQEHSKITFKKPLFEAFVSGIASNKSFLSQKEIDALPFGAILLPFLHGIRALTDYLNNNIYYKVAYENQNLDRAGSLFNFTKKALENLEFMQEITAKKLMV